MMQPASSNDPSILITALIFLINGTQIFGGSGIEGGIISDMLPSEIFFSGLMFLKLEKLEG